MKRHRWILIYERADATGEMQKFQCDTCNEVQRVYKPYLQRAAAR